MLEYKLYINQILENIDKIENSIRNTNKNEFIEDSELHDATLMRLQVIGENIIKIPPELKKNNKEIKWKRFEKLRNIISHKYDLIDYNLIWSFIENNIEDLKLAILKIK